MDTEIIAGAVDVVVPMRNGAATIQRTLATVHAQTHPPRRIIIVDDGSTDGGADLVHCLPLVELIATPPYGVSHARNTGVQAARTEYVAFLDADDLWHPTKLERQLMVARRDPAAALITCDFMSATPAGAPIPATTIRPRYAGRALQCLLHDFFVIGGGSSSILVRRDAFLRVGGYDVRQQFFEDIDLCLRLAAHGTVTACPEVLTRVVENPFSTMRRPQASPDAFNFEVTLQGLTAVEKWMDVSDAPARLGREAARHILVRFVRSRIPLSYLFTLPAQMQQRAPRLAKRIAPDMPRLLVHLAVASISGLRRMIGKFHRQLARNAALKSMPKPHPSLVPAVKTTA